MKLPDNSNFRGDNEQEDTGHIPLVCMGLELSVVCMAGLVWQEL